MLRHDQKFKTWAFSKAIIIFYKKQSVAASTGKTTKYFLLFEVFDDFRFYVVVFEKMKNKIQKMHQKSPQLQVSNAV